MATHFSNRVKNVCVNSHRGTKNSRERPDKEDEPSGPFWECVRSHQEFFATALEGAILLTPEGKICYLNDQMAKMIGYPPEELLGRSILDFLDPNTYQEGHKIIGLSRKGMRGRNDLCFRDRNGDPLWTVVSSSPMFDGHEAFFGILWMITDITDRESTQEKIYRSKKALQEFFDGIKEPLIMIDRSLHVIVANLAAREYYGLTWNEIIGKPYDQPAMEEGILKELNIQSTFTTGQEHLLERPNPRDPNRYEKVAIYPLREEEQGIKSAIIRVSDITGEKLAQGQLIQNEKLAALGLLISGIVHEINNPNNFISFNLPILRDFLEQILVIVDMYAAIHPEYRVSGMPYEEFREEILKLLHNLEHGSERINATISNLKEFTVLNKGQEPSLVGPSEVIEKAVAMCQGEIYRKVKFFDVQIDNPLPKILVNPGALEQVLVNLLINACQAMDKKDSWIRLKAFGRKKRREIAIEVSDNGHGMNEDVMGRIFEPFFTTKKPGAGTGLGLYVSQNLIESSGGEIEVSSQIGQGTTFTITLPGLASPLAEKPGETELEKRDVA